MYKINNYKEFKKFLAEEKYNAVIRIGKKKRLSVGGDEFVPLQMRII